MEFSACGTVIILTTSDAQSNSRRSISYVLVESFSEFFPEVLGFPFQFFIYLSLPMIPASGGHTHDCYQHYNSYMEVEWGYPFMNWSNEAMSGKHGDFLGHWFMKAASFNKTHKAKVKIGKWDNVQL